MPLTLTVPDEYGYTLVVAATSVLLNVYHFAKSGGARKAAQIPYPIPYATTEQAEKDPKAYAFNSAQRAHANYTENLAPFLTTLAISSLSFPCAGASLGAAWVVGRAWYAVGYTSQGPKGRTGGFIVSALAGLALNVLSVWSATKFLPSPLF